MTPEQQTRHMDRALTLAARGAGSVSPNPMVGAVLVAPDGETVWGEGWHGRYGGPHAEVWAVSATYFELTRLAAAEGTLFTHEDDRSFRQVAVLGGKAARRLDRTLPPAGGAMWRIHKAWCESHPEADGHGESFPCFHFKHPKFREQFEPKSEL